MRSPSTWTSADEYGTITVKFNRAAAQAYVNVVEISRGTQDFKALRSSASIVSSWLDNDVGGGGC